MSEFMTVLTRQQANRRKPNTRPYRNRMHAKSLSKAAKRGFVRLYRGGMSYRQIALQAGVSETFIKEIVWRSGVPRRRQGGCERVTTLKQRESMCEEYAAGATLKAIGEKYGIAWGNVARILEYRGVERRKPVDYARQYAVDQEAFDNPTAEGRYWIGFLMTDGCVSQGNQVKLTLALKDFEHVEKLKQFMKSEHRIKIENNSERKIGTHAIKSGPVCTLSVYSERLATALVRYGVVARKTNVAKVRLLEMDRDFWRGVIDGDGSVLLVTRRNNTYPLIALCGASPHLMSQFADYAESVVGKRPKVYFVKNGAGKIYRLSLEYMHAARMIKHLYQGCCVSLARKQRKADTICSTGSLFIDKRGLRS